MIAEDVSTKWVELFAIKVAGAEECAQKLIKEVFLQYGIPRRMTSDNGVQFISSVMQQVCHVLGVIQSLTPFYHPEANMVERKNRDLKPRLAMMVKDKHTTWPEHLSTIRFAMNTAKDENTGYSSAYLTFGRELRTLDDVQNDLSQIVASDNFIPMITPYLRQMVNVWQDARSINEANRDQRKEYANKKLRAVPDYQVNDKVIFTLHTHSSTTRQTTSKFDPKRDGPYVISKKVSPISYDLCNVQNEQPLGVYHVSALQRFQGSKEVTPEVGLRRRGLPKKIH